MPNRITKWISLIERCGLQYRDDNFKEFNISGNHHSYLFVISHNPGITQEELAKKMHINKSNITRNITLLIDKGLVIRKTCINDKRAFNLYLTSKAKKLLPALIDKQQFWNNVILKSFNDEQINDLINKLKQIAFNACEYTNEYYSEEE